MNASATRFVQRFIPASSAGLWVLWCLTAAPLHAAIFGEFAGATDVGKIELQGSAAIRRANSTA